MYLSQLILVTFMLLIFNVYPAVTESLDSDSVSPGEISESPASDTVPTEKLEDVTKSPDAISETTEEANESAEESLNDTNPPDKPLGVREAEGRVIGE